MAIKRVIYELDDSKENNPITGSTFDKIIPDKEFLSNQTKSLDAYKDVDVSKSDNIPNTKPIVGRTVSDLIIEFKNDGRYMTLLLFIISFVIFINKMDSLINFQYPMILGAFLNLVWHLSPFIKKKISKQ